MSPDAEFIRKCMETGEELPPAVVRDVIVDWLKQPATDELQRMLTDAVAFERETIAALADNEVALFMHMRELCPTQAEKNQNAICAATMKAFAQVIRGRTKVDAG